MTTATDITPTSDTGTALDGQTEGCSTRCRRSITSRCRCSCHGVQHGVQTKGVDLTDTLAADHDGVHDSVYPGLAL